MSNPAGNDERLPLGGATAPMGPKTVADAY